MKKLDLSKPVELENGNSVRIICSDRLPPTPPIVALIGMGELTVHFYDKYGINGTFPHHQRLINKIIKKVGWTNIYKKAGRPNTIAVGEHIYRTKGFAVDSAAKNAIAVGVKIEWEEE